ncbi:hypothetical protein ACLESO_08050 [Pyxidicoccus sp. 3LG]
MSWAAQMERLAINERFSAARERGEAWGKTWGCPSRFTRADLAKLGALRVQGRALREIAIALKVPRSTVPRALAPKVGADRHGQFSGNRDGQQGAAR